MLKSGSKGKNCAIAKKHLLSAKENLRRGETGRCFSQLSLALSLDSDLQDTEYTTYIKVLEDWSLVLQENQRYQETFSLFEVALKIYGDSPDIYYLLANLLFRNGHVREAWSYAGQAKSMCPKDPQVQELFSRLAAHLVDRWHFPMLNDATRNKKFQTAIKKAVQGGWNTVLDIGAGTGLLSVYAKESGAKAVYACEMDPFMYEMAEDVLQRNNANTVFMQNVKSTDMKIPVHIPQKVSLVISETMDAGLFGEQILHTLDHAWRELLSLEEEPGATQGSELKEDQSTGCGTNLQPRSIVIPHSAKIYIALVQCDYIASYTKVLNHDSTSFCGKVLKMDPSDPYTSEKMDNIPGGYTLLSSWELVLNVNFNSPVMIKEFLHGKIKKVISSTSISSGRIDAICLAFDLHLDDEEILSSLPDNKTCWENAVYPVTIDKTVEKGEVVDVDFHCDGAIYLALSGTDPVESTENRVSVSPYALQYINSSSVSEMHILFKAAVIGAFPASSSIVICDLAPFPLTGLSLLSHFKSCKLYIEDRELAVALSSDTTIIRCVEDLDIAIDVLLLWPLSKEGTLLEGLHQQVLMYRERMTDRGLVLPDHVELHMQPISSDALDNFSHASDSNTAGVQVAEVINLVRSQHHIDLALSAVPHTVLAPPIAPLTFSLTQATVHTSPLFTPQPSTYSVHGARRTRRLRMQPVEATPCASSTQESLRMFQNSGASTPHQEASTDFQPVQLHSKSHHTIQALQVSNEYEEGHSPGETRRDDANSDDNNNELLVVGGQPTCVTTTLNVEAPGTTTAVAYWFVLRLNKASGPASLPSSSEAEESIAVFSSFSHCSPCNQSLFLLEERQEVARGDRLNLSVIWRKDVFSMSINKMD
ncbi:protein arginine N-methyltransferase 9-like [Oratosquilla oratoria]|uniref:protein arginine N-methyltransferase 9-like n=1 Tax=Oratosquilla oratoria TaxID=337810 RepID=UPI003F759F0C